MPLITPQDVGAPDRPVAERPLRFSRMFGRVALAGAVAGLLAGVFSLLVTERAMAPALELEASRATAESAAHVHQDELVGRGAQLIGGFLGTVFAGVALGIVFAVVYGLVRHRLPGGREVARTAVLAAIGFGFFGLLPALAIPANPPAVGDPATVHTRTAIYGAVLLLGAIGAMLVGALVSAMRSHGMGDAGTVIGAVVATAAMVTLILVFVPGNPDPIAADVPRAVVWNFRLASLGQLAVLWATLGLTGGWLLDRLHGLRPADPAEAEVAEAHRAGIEIADHGVM